MEMRAFFKEIFTYQHHCNAVMAEQLGGLKGELDEKWIQLFCHVINAHQIWNARILQKSAVGVRELRPMEANVRLNASNFAETLEIIEQMDLSTAVEYRNSRGEAFSNRVCDILFHISNHSTHHRAQIASALRMQGIAPIPSDYIFYKR